MRREVRFAERHHEAHFRLGDGELSSFSSLDGHGQCSELASERCAVAGLVQWRCHLACERGAAARLH